MITRLRGDNAGTIPLVSPGSGLDCHLADTGLLPPGTRTAHLADACWVLTGPHLFTQLTADCGWSAEAYETWLAGMLAAAMLGPP
ncbi:hypothetical protein [Streptomyces sp. NPDC058249]|uniref:hypothetical protein n=1 Tax=Streptomyces sp. NPDC058249 TaxID=3346403 RepID=UPI0036EA56FF